MEEQRKIEEEQQKKEEQEARQKLILATAAGTRYIGTITNEDGEVQRLRLVFTEQDGVLIRAEASNPDRRGEKQTFTGELVFDPKPEKGRPDTAYPIVMSPIGKQDLDYSVVWGFYRQEGSLKLYLTDIGLEGKADMGGWGNDYIIRLQRGDIKSIEPGRGEKIPPIQDKKERRNRGIPTPAGIGSRSRPQ
jgi:hypothetical protein